MGELEQMQLSILHRAQARLAADRAGASDVQLEQLVQDIHSFFTAWQSLSSTASSILLLDSHPGVRKQAARILAHVNALEAELTSSQAVFASLQAMQRSAAAECTQSTGGQPQGGATALILRSLMLHMQRQGYHTDPAAWSVVLTRDEKLRLLEDWRSSERQLVAQGMHLLHSTSVSPDVQVSSEELQADPVLARVVQMQHASSEGSSPTDGRGVDKSAEDELNVQLNLSAAAHILRHHPDAALREQVYDMAVEPRGLQALKLLEDLSRVRSKIATCYGLDSYSQLSHAGSLVGCSDAATQFLSSMARGLQPAAQQQVKHLQGQCKGQARPCDLDWAMASQHRGPHVPPHDALAQQVSLPTLLKGLSGLLKGTIGVWLEPFTPSSQRPSQQLPEHTLMSSYLAALQPSTTAAPAPGSPAPDVFVYAVHHEDQGLVGSLVVHASAGCGARYLSMGGPVSCEAPLDPSPGQPVHATSGATAAVGAVPAVLLGLQWGEAHSQSTSQLAGLIRELLHEAGHALHLILSHHSPRTGGTAALIESSQSVTGFAPCPLELPLELLELPASLMELLCAQPQAVHQLLAAVKDAGIQEPAPDAAVIQELAQAIARENQLCAYSPLHLLIQTTTAILDTLLLNGAPGTDAVQLWVDLCSATLPRPLPPMFTVQQAQSLQRFLELRGCGYAYLAAWALAMQAWHTHGLDTDPCNPAAWRQVRQLVYAQGAVHEQQLSAWLHAVAGDGVRVHTPGASENGQQGGAMSSREYELVTWHTGAVVISFEEVAAARWPWWPVLLLM